MIRPDLGGFIALSLAIHAAALVYTDTAEYAAVKPAGPLRLTLLQEADQPPGKRTDKAAGPPATGKPVPRVHHATRVDKEIPHPLTRVAGRAQQRTLPVTRNGSATPAAPGTAGAAAPGTAAMEAELQGQLRRALLPHFSYPLLARRRGWEGIVRVGVRIEADGALTGLHLVEASPHAVLNRAAVESLKRVARLPGAGTALGGRHVDLVLPVEYRLTDT
jgi:protein TonB